MDLENLSDSDDDPPHARKPGGGMGIRVSSLEHPEGNAADSPEDSIHGFAISGDVMKLQQLLNSSSDKQVDVNSRDEYVCTHCLGALR